MEEMGGSKVAALGHALPWAIALVVLAGSPIGASPAWAARSTTPVRRRYAKIVEACPAPAPGHATCFALVRKPVVAPAPDSATGAGVQPFVAGGGAASAGPAGGLTPEDLAGAYGYVPAAGGSGQTVGIVDAYDDPSIESDLATFDAQYGLPACTTANECFKKVGQSGSTSSLPPADKVGWSVEIALDVEAVRAACPNCRILLVEGNSSSFANLASATNEAVALGATEVSNSYGGLEIGPGATERAAYNHPGVPILASTGDDGYYDWDFANFVGGESGEMPNTPASLPSVIAVGGTTLELNPDGTRNSESVWNWSGPGDEFGEKGATGGGCSTRFSAQPWQRNVAGFAATGCGTDRLDADVSAVADPDTGLDIYDTYNCGAECTGVDVGWETIGGTSLSAPFVSALYALAGGAHGLSYPALTLYGQAAGASSRFDVTEGGNGACGGESVALCGHLNSLGFGLIDCEGTTACNAAPGFDGPSGVGTPIGLGLFKPQLPTAAFTAPALPKAGLSAGFSVASSSDPYPGGTLVSYAWSWGDGSPGSTGVSSTHTYAAPGTYSVTLIATDNYGLASSASTQSVEVLKQTVAEEEAKQKKGEEEAANAKHEEEATKAKHEQEASAKSKLEEEQAAALKHEEPNLPAATVNQEVTGLQAQAPAAVPNAQLAGTTLTVSAKGAVTVKVSCAAGESNCKGTVVLRTLTAVSTSSTAAAAKRAILTVASASFAVAGGKTATVTLHLSAKARTLLARLHVLRLLATIAAHDPAGAQHTTKTTVTVLAAKAKHGKH